MKKILAAFIVSALCIAAIAQNNVTLKLNLEKNKVYRFMSSSEQTITQTINGNQQVVDSKTNNSFSIKMIDLTPAFLIAEVRFDTIISNTNMMGKTIKISSANEGNIKSAETSDIMSYIRNRLSKNALYVKMDFTGKVIDIVNSKMISDAIMKDTSNLTVTGQVKAGIKKQIEDLVGNDNLKTMIETFTHCLPGKEVAAGGTWDVTINSKSGGMSLDIITNYHLDGISGSSANVTCESNIKAALNAEPMVTGPGKITYDDLKGLSKSNMVIDINTGLISEVKAKTHMAGNLAFSMPGMSMQIPMDISGESKVNALK